MDSVKGLEALKARFNAQKLKIKVQTILSEEAEKLRQEAEKSIADLPVSPQKQAQLRASLTLQRQDDGLSWTLSSDSKYGETFEYGTENTTELPWLGPSLVSYKGQYYNCLRDRLITTLSTSGSSG